MSRWTEIETFRKVLNEEAATAARVMESIPSDQYDFRPDPAGRSRSQSVPDRLSRRSGPANASRKAPLAIRGKVATGLCSP